MKCKKLFALLLSLCMMASTFVALPVSAATNDVIDINLPLDDASELTWVASSSVTVSNADGIGGRDDVVKVEGLANSNNNTAGVKLPDGFAFQKGDVLTFSVDVYSDSVINPDMWLRNHPALNPMAIFYEETIAANTWTTISRTATYDELEAMIAVANSSGSFATAGNYALYIRPRTNATAYLDNFKVKVTRQDIERENVIDIEVADASDITWKNGGVATDADGIGGRDGVVELSNLANANGNTAGVKFPDGFAFQEGDILSYSFDVYSDTVTNPDIWLRNHDASLNPFTTFYHTSTVETWTTIEKTVSYSEISAFGASGNYALYIRPRQTGTVYVDNFKVTVSRPVVETFKVVDVTVGGASELTWIASEAVTATDANGIGGRDGVIKAEGVANANGNTVGIKLGDKFAFREGDVLTYSVDVYSDSAVNPDIWLRNHTSESTLSTFTTFYNGALTANTWTTIEKKVTYADLVATGVTGWEEAGAYALYVRLRDSQNATVYLDNFTVTVTRAKTGEPTIEKLDYVAFEDGKYIVTTAAVVENELQTAASSQVRVRIIPEETASTSDSLKVSFDFKAEGILNSQGNLYEAMPVGLRLYDSVDGTTQANTIGYIKSSVPANLGTAVTAEFYIEDMENGGGTSTLTEIKSIGIQVDMGGAYTQYEVEENGGYFTISNIKVEKVAKPEHTHVYSAWTKDDDNNHKKVCACGDVVTEAHTWNAGAVTQEPTEDEDGIKTYTCRVCKGTKTEAINKLLKGVKVIDINLPVDDASELTFVQSGVTVSNVDSVGGRDKVVKAEGVANGNDNTVGIALADNFKFLPGDILKFSVDIYSETEINPDLWLRNHAGSLEPYEVFFNAAIAANTWTTLSRTTTYQDWVDSTASGAGDWATEGNFKFYLRPRSNATVYLDNISVSVIRDIEDVVDITVNAASDITWKGGEDVTATDVDGIGGRDGVVELAGLGNGNGTTAGISLPEGFEFKENDVITYSVDVYSDTVTHPDVWLRNHSGDLTPFTTFYHEVPTGEWTTITKTVAFDELGGTGDWTTKGNFALYVRPRESGTVYVDNFNVTVSRVFTGEPTINTLSYVTNEDGTYKVTTADVVANEAEQASSSTVRMSIVPERPISKDAKLKVSFDFNAVGILNSVGDPYELMQVNLRLYDSENGGTNANTIGYILNDNVLANKGEAIPVEFYIDDMVQNGGTSELTEIKSIGIQVNMGGAYTQYGIEANDGYYTISNIKVESVAKDDHTHAFIGYKKAGEAEGNHAKICACGYTEDELHIWDEGVVEGTVKTYTCVCGAQYTEEVAPAYTAGDANGDNEVDVKDVIAIRRHIAGGYSITINEAAANVNGDDKIDVKDAIAIRRYIAGGYGIEFK